VLPLLDQIKHEAYYVKMAVAWAISIAYVKQPEVTMPYLKHNTLDDFTYNKALQKITESYRVTPEDKQMIRGMKRKVRKQTHTTS
jgi:3-methyladenine DNA glycosylase AlkD